MTSRTIESRQGDERDSSADPMLSRTAQLRRVDFSGTVWFAAALVADAVAVGGLLASGWRPRVLPVPVLVGWWVGLAVSVCSLGCLAWAGCPVLGKDLRQANRNKALTVRVGVVGCLLGGVLALLAVLLEPAR